MSSFTSLPTVPLAPSSDPARKAEILATLRQALFETGFLYVTEHGVPESTINALTSRLPLLFDLPVPQKHALSKLNSPHFLGYSGYAEERTKNAADLREQFDFATELPAVSTVSTVSPSSENGENGEKDGKREGLFWRLRGPNQYPAEELVPGFRQALQDYEEALAIATARFVCLIEEALEMQVGTFAGLFKERPQNRLKLVKYPPTVGVDGAETRGLGVGAHKDSSGWLTFLLQTGEVGKADGLEVLTDDGEWFPVPNLAGSFVVNFGNAFEAATEGAVRATIHRVQAPTATSKARYSIPFFQGLPLDLTVRQIREYIPESVRSMRRKARGEDANIDSFLDERWGTLGESQLRKWIRSHPDVGEKWYGKETVQWYLQ